MLGSPPLALLAFVAGLSLLLGSAVWVLAVRLRRAERERRRASSELSRRLSELFALQELSYVLAESLDSERIVEQVVRYAVRFGETSGALVALAGNSPGVPWRIAAAEGTLAGLAGQPVPEDDSGIIGRSAGQEQMELAERRQGGAVLLGEVTVEAAAAVPLRAHGIVVGTLVAVDPAGGEFTPDGLRLLSTVATHAAIVIANARFFEMVRRGKEQWETAFDALSQGLAVVDADDRVVRANRSLATLLGAPVPRLIGERLAAPLLGTPQGLADVLTRVRRGERLPPVVVRSTPLDRILRVSAAPILSTGAEQHVVVLVDDITAQQALESQLIQSEKLAAVGQLVSGVAHELNNPLTSITGLAEFLVEQKELGPKDRGHLRVIHEQAERAGRIVRNLLTFARQGPADRSLVDLNDVSQRTILLISHDLRVRDIEVLRELDPSLPPVLGDRHELQQVLLNLLTNAAQAVSGNPPETPRTITVTTWADEQVHLRVTDGGPGIPDAIMPRLFTPFFTTKEPGHGTGLGLSICFSIVTAHGGRIEAERPGRGAAVRIDLPRASADATVRLAEPAQPAPPTPPGRRAILVVDDDPAVRVTVEALFGREGHTVEVARATPLVIDLLRDRRFDLVIVDALAAARGGERLFVEELVERLPGVRNRILVATGDVRPSTEQTLGRIGVPYVRKPFNLRDLRNAAARVWAAGAVS